MLGYKPLVALFVVSVLASPLVAHGQSSRPTFVAVVRHDGSMIPLAVFDGQQWWNRWPEPMDDYDHRLAVPERLSSLPADWLPPGMRLPTEWRLYSGNGRTVPIKALRPVRTEMLDRAVIGIQTDYRTARQDDVAVAISGPVTVAPFVRARRQESDAVAAQLATRLATLEATAIAQWIKETDRPSDTGQKLRRVYRDRARNDPAAFSLMRVDRAIKGRTYYYLTGEKLYAFPDSGGCRMNMSFEGIVALDPSGRVIDNVSAMAWAEYCGDRAISYDPIAMVQIGERVLWVGIEQLEDGFSYFLMDPDTKEPLKLRRHPFVRVRVPLSDRRCPPGLCRVLDRLRAAARSRRFSDVAPFIAKDAEQVFSDRNLALELRDPASIAWPIFQRLLASGGSLRWRGTTYCAPGIYESDASDEQREAFRKGAEVDDPWVVLVPAANVYAEPNETARVIAVVGHELVAVTNALEWSSPNAADSWVTVRWDTTMGYMRWKDVAGSKHPGLCLDRENGAWRITYFRGR